MRQLSLFSMLFFVAIAASYVANGEMLSLEKAVIVTPGDCSVVVEKACQVLQEEIQRRTGILLQRREPAADNVEPILLLEKAASQTPEDVVSTHPEGYSIWIDNAKSGAPTLHVLGRDDRGVLFGVGKLLRSLRLSNGAIAIDTSFRAKESPRCRIRGHELGYRNKSNTYDAWSVNQFDQYVRDLAVFGINTIQLVCELEHMDREGLHMVDTVWERTPALVDCIHSYGLRVWLWLPPGAKAFDPATRQETLDRCNDLFRRCSSLDAVFVPGGDPGDAHPEVLLPWVKEMATLLRRTHPGAEVWISNEDMPHEWNEYLFQYLNQQKPGWLTGLIFGTWVKMSLSKMRSLVPSEYPIVQYADITHCIECQYPVPDWDRAFAFTLGREAINPRPRAMGKIFAVTSPYTEGFIGYSDGVNDDLNKVVWAQKGWNPETSVEEIVSEYARYFSAPDIAERLARGWFQLEENWRGPLRSNKGVLDTLQHWQTLQKEYGESAKGDWRFQMGLFRAYYDAYVYEKLLADEKAEREALAILRDATEANVDPCLLRATQALQPEYSETVLDFRKELETLGKELFQEIGIQMSVPLYGAANWERGAVLDALDMPLSDAPWIGLQIDEIGNLASSDEKLRRIDKILNWEIPTPGTLYDDLGNATKQPHLVDAGDWEKDPGFVESPQNEYIEIEGRETWRQSWRDQAQTLYGTPLRLRYVGLDPNTTYNLQVTYTGRFKPVMRLVANGTHEIHPALPQPAEVTILKFPIPKEATETGTLTLEWTLEKGRGCQVAEVWLIPDETY